MLGKKNKRMKQERPRKMSIRLKIFGSGHGTVGGRLCTAGIQFV